MVVYNSAEVQLDLMISDSERCTIGTVFTTGFTGSLLGRI